MNLINAVFFWIPKTDVFMITKVGHVPTGGRSTGAVFSDWSKVDRVKVALSDVLTAICRDGVDPVAVANALSSVDELRDALPVDFFSALEPNRAGR